MWLKGGVSSDHHESPASIPNSRSSCVERGFVLSPVQGPTALDGGAEPPLQGCRYKQQFMSYVSRVELEWKRSKNNQKDCTLHFSSV